MLTGIRIIMIFFSFLIISCEKDESDSIEDFCINEDIVNTSLDCPTIFDPVCGCNDVTYENSCIALNFYGISDYTQGICSSDCKTTFDCD